MNNALKILISQTQNVLFVEQSIYSYVRIKMIRRRNVKWKKLRNEYFFNRYFLVVQTFETCFVYMLAKDQC